MSTPAATIAPPPADPANGVAYRLYQGTVELGGMMEANHRLRTLCGTLEPIDMASIEHRYAHLVNSDPLVDCVIATRDGATVGYARVEWHDMTDGDRNYDLTAVVAPDAWGIGITGTLVDWCESRLRQVAAGHPADRTSWLATFVFDGDEEQRAALEARGYELVRRGAEMLRPDLKNLPDVVIAEGYSLRTPEEDELTAVYLALVESFRDAWGEPEDQDEETMGDWVDDPRFRRDLVAVAWCDGAPVAISNGKPEVLADGSVRGYVDVVATHPDHRRRGLARAVLTEVLHRLQAAGATSAYLGVDAQGEHRAYALYEHVGFRKASGETVWRRPLLAAEEAR
jgi:ribosomal protein S18 acetylase RimI-like enzyme